MITTICYAETVAFQKGHDSFVVAGLYRISQRYIWAVWKLLLDLLKNAREKNRKVYFKPVFLQVQTALLSQHD